MLKRILKSAFAQAVACRFISAYIALVGRSIRWRQINPEIPRAFWEQDKPFIFAFWHGRLLMMTYLWPRTQPVHMLISQHRDGQIIAKTVAFFGVKSIAGSSTRGGVGALRALVKALKNGDNVGITPDGPRGPRMHASDGVIAAARLGGVPILPAANSVQRGRFLRTWDRFLLPCPFTSGVMAWGEPIIVDKNDDPEAARRNLETVLVRLQKDADTLCGHTPVEPAVVDPDTLEARR